MSVNRYDASTGELTNIASGQRTWVGTQAAYKAAKQAGTLPNNAIIAITDDEQDHNHYSTEETETGMYWIDGKPIYRKVIETTSPTAVNIDTIIYSMGGIDSFIDMFGYVINPSYGTYNQFMPLNWTRGMDTYITISNDTNRNLSIHQYCSSSNLINRDEKICITYTKTIDA